MGLYGIDFGTTNSVICESSWPPHVLFNDDGDYVTVTRILSVSNIKRLVGVTYDQFINNKTLNVQFDMERIVKDPESEWCAVNSNGIIFSLQEVISMYLVSLVPNSAHDTIQAVLTVPSHYSNVEKGILKRACDLANIDVIRFMNEPTAAALAYHFNNNSVEKNEVVLVLDCGGGTTDVSVVNMDYESGIFQVETTVGNHFLGGEDITNNLVKYVSKLTEWDCSDLKKECEEAKKRLSFQLTTKINNKQISRAKFIDINKEFFESIKALVLEASFGYTIDKYILVGGSTRIPYFKEMLRELKGNDIIINDTLNPEHIVSIGAAYQGLLLTTHSETLKTLPNFPVVIDVVGVTIGVETIGGIMSPVISKNTHIPSSITKIFTNDKNYVSDITIRVFAGNRKLCKDNTFIGSFTLKGLDDTLRKGEMNIRIKFDVDVNNIVVISAFDSKTNAFSRLELDTAGIREIETNFEDIMDDSIQANKILAKQNLYDTFLRLLCYFHANRHIFVDDTVTLYNNFYMKKLNELFNSVFNIIVNNDAIQNVDEVKAEFEETFNYYILNLNTKKQSTFLEN
jgi:molecular chaperone DnaK (HSP70)